jgi:DNA-binding PadR family transcriptional regulator
MSASYALLGILGRQPTYGYDLKRNYDEIFGKTKPLAIGYLYQTLSRLTRDKKITTAAATGPSRGPERKQYAITTLGREDLRAWLSTADETRPTTQMMLFTKVVTAILVDEDPNICLDAQRLSHLQRMHELTNIRNEGNLSQTLQADYDLFRLEAELRWIDVTSARLETLTKEVQSERKPVHLTSS